MKLQNVTVGADCEVFLQDKASQKIVSAEGIIRGTKDVPFVFDETNKYFCTSLDNILAEFCIPPAKTAEEFYAHLKKSIGYVNNTIPKELCVAITPAALVDDIWLMTPNAQRFGCEPDFNAYTGFVNQRPFGVNPNLRSAGGHLHIGYDNPTPFNINDYMGDVERCTIIKTLDLFIGIPSIIMEPENMRKQLYGKAGAFRPKEYGVEYRTVSNFYLDSDNLISWAYNAVQNAVDFINNGHTIPEGTSWYINDAINNNDREAAANVINEYNLQLVAA